MTQTYDTPMSRIDARIPLAVRDMIDHAAAMQGRTRTDFLIAAALEKAEAVISEQNLLRLTARDQETLARSLLNNEVQETTPFLSELTAEYKDRVKSL